MFKFSKQKEVKSVNEIIEEIHETFYTEVNRLLESAKIQNSLETGKQSLIQKQERLKALGFTNTQEVKEAELELKRLEELRQNNEEKKTLVEAINYFSFKYPHYKFITEESVKNICAKYNLVYGEISRYTGTVPDKNLEHIENFKIMEEDECYVYETYYSDFMIGRFSEEIIYQTKEEYEVRKTKENGEWRDRSRRIENNFKCPLEIAAPLKDFNLTSMEIKDFKLSNIEIPDPVVLKPVIFKGQKSYLIITAWGLEGSDELVVNTRNN